MDKIIEKILNTIEDKMTVNNDELKLFKLMLLVFYIYHGEDHELINPSRKLYKLSKKDRKLIEDQIIKHNFLKENVELYKLGIKFDNYIESNNRARTGSFYTPEDLAIGIVRLTLSDYFKSKDDDIYIMFRQNRNILDREINDISLSQLSLLTKAYNKICHLNVVDLACGTGMFLLSFLKLAIEMRLKIDLLNEKYQVKAKLNDIKLDKIHGFDLQNNPINILKLSLLDLALRYDFIKYIGMPINSYDSLKASRSRLLSSQDLNAGFDIVFGNPPYIGEKGNKDIFEDIRTSKFGLDHYEGKMDYFYYFIYKGMSLLKEDGVLGYITTNYFISADGAVKLRAYLKEKCYFLSVLNFNDIILFPSAPGQHNMIFTLKKKELKEEKSSITVISREDVKKDYNVLKNIEEYGHYVDQALLYDENDKIILIKDGSYYSVIKTIIDKSNIKIADFISVKQGIVSGADRVSKLMLEKKISEATISQFALKKDDPIFVLDSSDRVNVEKNLIKPFYKNSSIDNYFVDQNTDKNIIYLNEEIEDFEKKYPLAYDHFSKYKEVLEGRREVANGSKAWYLLQWGRSEDVFLSPRIVVPQRASRNKFALGGKDFYGSADIYYLYINNNMHLDELELNYYLLALLNSKLYYFWLYNMGKRKGNLLELYSKPISQIPIYLDPNSKFYKSIVKLVSQIFLENYNDHKSKDVRSRFDSVREQIDDLIYKAYAIDESDIIKVECLYKSIRKVKL